MMYLFFNRPNEVGIRIPPYFNPRKSHIVVKAMTFSLLIMMVFSCVQPENSLFKFDPTLIEENNIKLSDFADDLFYIHFADTFPLGLVYDNVKFTKESIFISVKDIGIIEYTRDGNFRKNIGKIGRGPGEYTFYVYFAIDDKGGFIYVLDRKNIIKVYSKSGRFLRNIDLEKYGSAIDAFDTYNSNVFVSFSIEGDNPKYKWIIIDSLGNIVRKKVNKIPAFSSSIGGFGGVYKTNDAISYWNLFSDTIFSIHDDFNEYPAFIISPGEHRLPKSKNYSMDQYFKFMKIERILETKRLLYIKFFFSIEKNCFAVLDKETNKTFLIYLQPENEGPLISYTGGIPNDLDNGVAFIPKNYFIQDGEEFLIGIINPSLIKTIVANNEFRNSFPKLPEKKKTLEKLANNLNETDNPVLMIVKLKKQY